MVAIGLSPFMIQLIASTVVVVLNRQLLRYSGEVAIGAMGAMFSIMTLLNMPVWGLIQGSQPRNRLQLWRRKQHTCLSGPAGLPALCRRHRPDRPGDLPEFPGFSDWSFRQER